MNPLRDDILLVQKDIDRIKKNYATEEKSFKRNLKSLSLTERDCFYKILSGHKLDDDKQKPVQNLHLKLNNPHPKKKNILKRIAESVSIAKQNLFNGRVDSKVIKQALLNFEIKTDEKIIKKKAADSKSSSSEEKLIKAPSPKTEIPEVPKTIQNQEKKTELRKTTTEEVVLPKTKKACVRNTKKLLDTLKSLSSAEIIDRLRDNRKEIAEYIAAKPTSWLSYTTNLSLTLGESESDEQLQGVLNSLNHRLGELLNFKFYPIDHKQVKNLPQDLISLILTPFSNAFFKEEFLRRQKALPSIRLAEWLNNEPDHFHDSTYSHPEHFKKILPYLHHVRITDQDIDLETPVLSQALKMKNLIFSSKIPLKKIEACLLAIPKPEKLQSISFSRQISTEIAASLPRFINLKKLVLKKGYYPKALNFLNQLPNLKSLHLFTGQAVSTEEMRIIGSCRNLKHLILEGFEMNDEKLQQLSPLNQLNTLIISHKGTFITDYAFENCQYQNSLQHLQLSYTGYQHLPVLHDCLDSIANFPELQTLEVDGMLFKDNGIKCLQKCQKLQSIFFRAGTLDPKAFAEFKFPKLKLCILNNFIPCIRKEDIQNIQKNCPELHTIIAHGAPPDIMALHIPDVITISNFEPFLFHLVDEDTLKMPD